MAGFRQTNVPPRPAAGPGTETPGEPASKLAILLALVALVALVMAMCVVAGGLAHAAVELFDYGWDIIDS